MGQSADRDMTEQLQPSPLKAVQEKIKEAEKTASEISQKAQADSLKLIRTAQAEASELEKLEGELEAAYEHATLKDAQDEANKKTEELLKQGKEAAEGVKAKGMKNVKRAAKLILDLLVEKSERGW